MTLGDERVALLDALAHVLLVEAAGELEQVVGARSGRSRRPPVPGRRRPRVCACDGLRPAAWPGGLLLGLGEALLELLVLALEALGLGVVADAAAAATGPRPGRRCAAARRYASRGDEALLELLVLLVEATQLDDDLVEEVVDLVLVVALTELRRLEPLVDYIFRSQRHGKPP